MLLHTPSSSENTLANTLNPVNLNIQITHPIFAKMKLARLIPLALIFRINPFLSLPLIFTICSTSGINLFLQATLILNFLLILLSSKKRYSHLKVFILLNKLSRVLFLIILIILQLFYFKLQC
jgi:hypothetical protein